MNHRLPLLVLVLGSLAPPAGAQELSAGTVKKAIDDGLAWLRTQQDPDGSFTKAARGHEDGYPQGMAALGALTLLKCGAEPDDPAVTSAFEYMHAQPPLRTYSVALAILAIEARYAPSHEEVEKQERKRSYTQVANRRFKQRAQPEDKKRLQEYVDWLITNRHSGGSVWRYPGPAQDGALEDNSNAQYAMLALKGARRLGIKVPLEVFEKVADYFVAEQDAEGEDVPWFPVPAADGPIYDMLTPQKREQRVRKEEGKGEGGTRERDPAASGAREQATMRARGWGYLPRRTEHKGGPNTTTTSGSMTASGIAALCIAKSELEARKSSWASRQEAVEQAIRDGCAWMASRFTPSSNPHPEKGRTWNSWKYYYLYGTERAGVLAGTYKFGEHDWWDEIAVHLLGEQRDDGSWPRGASLSALVDTCFALLFLKRATIPLVKLPPKRVMTGGGREYGD